MKLSLARAILPLLLAAAFTACEKDKDPVQPPVDDGFLPDTSPTNVLRNLEKAYEERRPDKYAARFAADEFEFEFSQRDRQTDPQIPFSWPMSTELGSAQNIANDPTVTRVVLNMTLPDSVPATAADNLPHGFNGITKVAVQNVHLEIHTETEDGEPLEYLVDRDGAEFFFRQYPSELIDGLPRWRIVYWRDRPAGSARLATENKTWGSVKNLYAPDYEDLYLANISASNVLSNLTRSYRERRISKYLELIDHSEFQFEFWPGDHEIDPSIPESWRYTDEWQATQHMLNDGRVTRVSVSFTSTDPVPATEDDDVPGGPDGLSKVLLQNVHLEVVTTTPSHEPLEYLVDRDGAELYFRQYPNELIDNAARWRIVYWRDKHVAGFATEPYSWGRIKHLYR